MTSCSSLSNFTTSSMGVGDHHFYHMGFHLLHLANNKKSASGAAVAPDRAPPKGCTVIRVGSAGEEKQRFVVPVEYLNHPLFVRLLKEAEEEYGFEHKGAISIPCQLHEFHHVSRIIGRDLTIAGHHHHHHDHHHHHHHLQLTGCFRA